MEVSCFLKLLVSFMFLSHEITGKKNSLHFFLVLNQTKISEVLKTLTRRALIRKLFKTEVIRITEVISVIRYPYL